MPETKKDLFFYDLDGEESSYGYHVVLTTPISNFEHVCGCADGNAGKLGTRDIGKKYDVKILDPIVIGECEFLGFGTYNFFPEVGISIRQRQWVVFKILKTGNVFSVSPLWCDVEPLS
ncbi:MAG: hypothetical protein WC842_04025 [Candidatus Paceibacterota bacterium]|jgi:hypothetical protein